MKIDHVEINGYKSIQNATLNLHPNVTILVGANASGKSNVIDALRFIRDVSVDGVERAVESRGITRIGFNAHPENNFEFDSHFLISFEIDPKEDKFNFKKIAYGFTVKGNTTESPQFSNEIIENYNKFDHTHSQYSYSNSASLNIQVERIKALFDNDSLGGEFKKNFIEKRFLYENILFNKKLWQFSTLYPNTLKENQIPSFYKNLKEDGSNWMSIVYLMQKTEEGKETLERIYEMMQVIIPDFFDVEIVKNGNYIFSSFRFGKTESNLKKFDPRQLSDGTLRAFCIFLSLYQNNEASLIIIEEPEKSIESNELAVIADAIKEIAKSTQIIITTHSPYLVEHFKPENIRVIAMNEGATSINTIRQEQYESIQEGLFTLGEFMAAEGLQPEKS